LEYVNRNSSEPILRQVDANQCPVRVDLPGRKENENDIEGSYFTYFDRDAIDALTRYWEGAGYKPKPGQPLCLREGLQKGHGTVNKVAVEAMWLRLLRHTGRIPPRKGPLGSRYGYNMHERRDAANTYLHVQAKTQSLDMDCVKFWSGRTGELDPNKYDKFWEDPDYVLKQYKIAGPYLNIISNPVKISPEQAAEIKSLREQVNLQTAQIEELTHLIHQLQGTKQNWKPGTVPAALTLGDPTVRRRRD